MTNPTHLRAALVEALDGWFACCRDEDTVRDGRPSESDKQFARIAELRKLCGGEG